MTQMASHMTYIWETLVPSVDLDLQIRKDIKDNGEGYYEYMLWCVDEGIAVSEHPKEALMEIDNFS